MNWSRFLQAFLDSAWAVKFRIILLAMATLLIGVTYLALETPKYKTSWIVLLPGTERASTINLDNLGEARSSGSNAYGSVSISPKNTYKEIALSDAVIELAAAEYKTEASSFSKPRIQLVDQTPAMKFTLKGTSVTDLRYRSELYNRTFHTVLDTLRKNEIERHYQGVEGNLSEARKRLLQAREAIVSYQLNSSLVSDEQFETWLSDAEDLRTRQSLAEVELAAQQATLDTQLRQLGVSTDQAQAFLLTQANPANREALALLSEKLARQASVSKLYGPNNPIKKQLDSEIAGIRVSLSANLRSVPQWRQILRPRLYGLLSSEMGDTWRQINQQIASHAATQARLSVLDEQRKIYSTRIKAHTREAARLSDLKRNHQIAEAIFSSALAKLDTNRLDIYATYPLTQLLTQPGATIKRDRLQAKLTLVAFALCFCMLSIATVLSNIRKTILAGTNPDEHTRDKPQYQEA